MNLKLKLRDFFTNPDIAKGFYIGAIAVSILDIILACWLLR